MFRECKDGILGVAKLYVRVSIVEKLNINLLLFNIILYKRKAQVSFNLYKIIFLKSNNFKVFFKILKTAL